MKQTINEYDFVRAFDTMNRSENFSVSGREALFKYLEELEEGMGEDLEPDVIAICCDYSEYSSIEEFIKDYGYSNIDPSEYDEDLEEIKETGNTHQEKREEYLSRYSALTEEEREEFEEAVKEDIQDNTQYIDIDGEAFIIQEY